MSRFTRSSVLLFSSALLIAASSCSSKAKKMDSLSDGYDKITIARNESAPGAESIRPEYISEIRKTPDVITAVSRYNAKKGQQLPLIDTLIGELRKSVGKIPGLISFNVHRGYSGVAVMNYLQFESKSSFDSWLASAAYRDMNTSLKPFAAVIGDTERLDVVFIQQ